MKFVRLYYSASPGDGTGKTSQSQRKACFNAILTAFYAVLPDSVPFLQKRVKSRENRGLSGWIWMDLRRNRGKKMDFPPKLWIFPVAFARKCAIMIESFEAGNTTVSAVFPTFLTSGGAVGESGIHFLRNRRLPVRIGRGVLGFVLQNKVFAALLNFSCMGY